MPDEFSMAQRDLAMTLFGCRVVRAAWWLVPGTARLREFELSFSDGSGLRFCAAEGCIDFRIVPGPPAMDVLMERNRQTDYGVELIAGGSSA